MNESRCFRRWLAIGIVSLACSAGTPATGAADDANRIEVFKPDGSRQCEPDSGTPAAAMRAELEAAGITVYAAGNRSDGAMHIQVCGAPTGRINVFSIDATALAEARAIGFLPLASPE